MAFKKPERKSLVVVAKRTSSLVSRVTGGLLELYRSVKQSQRRTVSLHVEGSCTTKNGRFLPDKAPLLASRYRVVEVIGNGSFGVVIQAMDTFHPDHCHVAIKVFDVSNSGLAYQEVEYTRLLNDADPHNCVHIIRLLDMFSFDAHICLVYELMSSLHLHHKIEIIPRTFEYKRKKLKVIRKVAVQLLVMLQFLYRMNVIHSDLKPDNVLLVKSTGSGVGLKVIDFGNAIRCTPVEIEPYLEEFNLQSLWYRAPEVLLGVSISMAIDMWSLGCILAELFLGRLLFFGRTREDMVNAMISQLSDLPEIPFKEGKFSSLVKEHFTVSTSSQESVWHQTGEKLYTIFCTMNKSGIEEREFASFLGMLLCYLPDFRATPLEALQHSFLKLSLPFRYMTDLRADYPVCNQFTQPPQEQTALGSIERLGICSLFRLSSLTPSKKPVQHVKPSPSSIINDSASFVTSPAHTEVTSSTSCETGFSVNHKLDLIEDNNLLGDCDDVLLIKIAESMETDVTGTKGIGVDVLTMEQRCVHPMLKQGKRKNALIPSSQKKKKAHGYSRKMLDLNNRGKSVFHKDVLGSSSTNNLVDDQLSVREHTDEECDVILF